MTARTTIVAPDPANVASLAPKLKKTIRPRLPKNPKWKKTKSSQNWLFPSLVVLVLLILVFLLRFLTNFSTNITKPITKSSSDLISLSTRVSDQTRIMAKLASQDGSYRYFVMIVDDIKKQLIAVQVPDYVEVEAPFGLGRVRLDGVFPLSKTVTRGSANEKIFGWQLETATLSELFGIPLDGYVVIESDCGEEAAKCLSDVLGMGVFLKTLPFSNNGDLSSNFSPIDLFGLSQKIGGIRFDRMKQVNIVTIGAIDRKEASARHEVNLARLDSFVQKNFADADIEDSRLAIEVVNGTKHPGLANNMARYATNLGGRVVSIGNFESDNVQSSVIIGARNRINRKIAQICNCDIVEQDLSNHRGDVMVVVGEDYYQKLYGE